MRFTKDNAAHYGSKSSRKGSKNKADTRIKDAFELLLTNNLDKIQEDLDEMKGTERVDILIRLAKFILPAPKTIELTTPEKWEIPTINFVSNSD